MSLSDRVSDNPSLLEDLQNTTLGHVEVARRHATSETAVRRWRQKNGVVGSVEELTTPYPNDDRPEAVTPHTSTASQWEPGVTIRNGEAEVRTVFKPVDQTPDHKNLLEDAGLDPDAWRITRISPLVRKDEGMTAYWFRAVPFASGPAVSSDDMDAILSQYIGLDMGMQLAEEVATYSRTDRILMVPSGDLQLGKPEQGGTEATIERFARYTNEVAKDLAASGGVKFLILPWLGDCASAETEIVTRRGIVKIGDVAGQDVEIKDGNGRWVKVPIKSYGLKPLTKVTWKSRKAAKVTETSPGHEWILSNGQRVRTESLEPGMSVRKSALKTNLPGLSQAGVQAGFVFGDGTDTSNGARAIFCGDKDEALLPWFLGVDISPPDGKGQRRTAARFPSSWKRLPSIDEGTSFLFGWLAGYFAADGCVDGHGGARISSASRENLEFVRSVCAVLGLDTWPIREVTEHASGRYNEGSLYEMAFGVRSLPDEFFLIPAHQSRVKDTRRKATPTVTWTVESVEATGRVEETFCCVVPTTSSFLLADGLLTSNCIEGLVSQHGRNIASLDMPITQQVRVYRRLMMHQIITLAPYAYNVLTVVVPGNHDQTTREQTMPHTDSWAIEGAAAAADYFKDREEFQHLSWAFPEHDEAHIAVKIDPKLTLGFTHGHVTGSNPAKVIDFWKGQSHGRQPLGEADILVSAHWHHLRVEFTGGGRTWVQIPAMDGGSGWYRQKTGDDVPSGQITLDLTPGVGAGWTNLKVYS